MSNPERVAFEAVVRPSGGASMFDDRFAFANLTAPETGRATAAAAELQRLGFRIRHIGTYSISGDGPRELWEQTFQTTLVRQDGVLTHMSGVPFRLPEELVPLVERAYPQRPPTFFTRVSPLPPRVAYHHLRVPDDVALVLRASAVHEQGITGRGVLVAMVDTGFYRHPFYEWHGYHLQATLAPDAVGAGEDAEGHGTAEVANVFAAARDVDLIGVKMGLNPTLAFKTAVDLHPAVITNSWGFDLAGERELPNALRPLEAAVVEAVEQKGIAVCFSAGNGHTAFPGMLPQVITAGGVYASPTVGQRDFDLAASDYASSFDSAIYPGRHVPDVCGLVGLLPRAVYLMLPVQPGNTIDAELAAAFPDGDDTAGTDGWAAISGTSAAAPQIAGVCALLKQARPDITPEQLKAVLKASARDVTTGHSAMGDEAGRGPDGPTGAGLVDALAAYKLARSLKGAR
jgi:serine protease AprX